VIVLAVSDRVADRFAQIPSETGRVHSVFTSACNIQWSDGRLLALHGPGWLRAPFAATVPCLPANLVPGGVVRRTGSRIQLPNTEELVADGAARIETSTPVARDMRSARFAGSLVQWGNGGPFLPSAEPAQRMIAAAITRRDSAPFVAGARQLIGLGEGLTPAGDDCLVGILAVLFRFLPGWIEESAVKEHVATHLDDHTTTIGREFVWYALRGSFSEPIVRLLTADSDAAAQRAAQTLCTFGATSGADTLAGVKLALDALTGSESRCRSTLVEET
jgi:Protein of unknown function (DUF2877)